MIKTKKLSVEEVEHVAGLSSLPLTSDETTKFQEQLSGTVNYFDDLNKVDTENISLTAQVTGKTNEFRQDEVTPSLSQEDALKNAPKSHNGFFVSKIEWN